MTRAASTRSSPSRTVGASTRIFADQLGGHFRSGPAWRPARSGPIDATKSRFVGEHDAQAATPPGGGAAGFVHSVRKAVFLKASWPPPASAPRPRYRRGSSPTEPAKRSLPADRPSPITPQAAVRVEKSQLPHRIRSAESPLHEQDSHSARSQPIIRDAVIGLPEIILGLSQGRQWP